MPKYIKSNVTAKDGVNYVRGIVEHQGCIFHKIELENDLGIDANIELIRDETPLHKQVAVQIKSGTSYYNETKDECLIPIKSHRDYWLKHPLPVIGIVYVPAHDKAYWVDIKAFLEREPDATVIRFQLAKINTFSERTFSSLFVSLVLNETPMISYDEAVSFLQSKRANEIELGVQVLFRRYPNQTDTWDHLVNLFENAEIDTIPWNLIYYFAHVPWHGDIWSRGQGLTEETRGYVREKHFSKFGVPEVVKLLGFIDEESMISRGTIGQSVEAIVSSLPMRSVCLREILSQQSYPIEIREKAATIFAMNEPQESLPFLKQLAEEGSEWMGDLLEHVREFGGFNPYA
jgi:hypothetical protein